MKNLKYFSAALMIAVLIFSAACKKQKDDPIIPNEEELITSLYLIMVDSLSNDTVTMSFVDLDGDGGNAPIVITENLTVNRTYFAQLYFMNEAKDPAEDITEEVEAEGVEHQVFYQTTPGLGLITHYLDDDFDGNPIGLATKVTTMTASAGELTITLRHEPDKNAPGVSDGDISNAGGETDIEVTFDVEIQ